MSPFPAAREKALRLLILGGTTEASGLARALADRLDVAPLLSFAGRTACPAPPPVPHRVGGFGGVDGLRAFLHQEAIDAVIDATHPFAARISANALAACEQAGVPLAVYTRPAWVPTAGDQWHAVPDIAAAVEDLAKLGKAAAYHPGLILSRVGIAQAEGGLRVFLTTGRLDLARFCAAPQHRYIVRTIEPPEPADMPPHAVLVLARPPFTVESEMALMRAQGVDLLVTKNSGGTASAAKLAAARALGIPVLLVDRPKRPRAIEFQHLDSVLAWTAETHAKLLSRPHP